MAKENTEARAVWTVIMLIFMVFLAFPLILLLLKSFQADGGISLANYKEIFAAKGFLKALRNSLAISALGAAIATGLAFIMAYTVNYTNVGNGYKKTLKTLALLPMLLPTITYGFAIIYSFGKQGLFTRLLGRQAFDIYESAAY